MDGVAKRENTTASVPHMNQISKDQVFFTFNATNPPSEPTAPQARFLPKAEDRSQRQRSAVCAMRGGFNRNQINHVINLVYLDTAKPDYLDKRWLENPRCTSTG